MGAEPSWRTVCVAGVGAAVVVVAGAIWLLPSDIEPTPAPTPTTLPPPIDPIPGAGFILDGFLPSANGLGPEWVEVLRFDSDDDLPDGPVPGEIFTIMRECGDDVVDHHSARGVATSVFTGPDGGLALFGATLHPDEDTAEDMLATFGDREALECLAGVRETEFEEAIVTDVEIDSSVDDLIVPEGFEDLVVARRIRTDLSRGDRSIAVFSDVMALRQDEYVLSMVFTTAGSAVELSTRSHVLAEAYQRALTAPEPPTDPAAAGRQD